MSDLASLGATEAAELIRSGRCASVDVVRACLDRIDRFDRFETGIHAWVHVDPDRALAAAASVDDRRRTGAGTGGLGGVPVGVKDIFNTIDMPTQMGSPIWSGFRPGNDARVVHYLRMADAVVLGKTVTAEFAVHTPGVTRNPHHPDHMPGTSSSGSAAAVAANMVPVALGTQTAGSIIRPASYCGVYGMKPSFGLIPRTGMLKTTDSLDTVGFFARNPEDLELMLDATRVHGRDYPLSEEAISDPARQRKGERPWRVALVDGPKAEDAEPYARATLHGLAGRLASEGLEVEALDLPSSFAAAHDIHGTIYDRTLAYYFKEEFKKGTLISGLMYEIIERGNRIPLDRYVAALDAQAALAAEFDALMTRFDALLTLSTGGAALRGLNSADRPDSCLVWTLCGAPSISVPVFVAPDGLPFGAQLVSRRFNDPLLLSLVRDLAGMGIAPRTTHPPLSRLAPA